ncbi:FHA domain-containing protein [Oscillatoria sp. CS-180]|uniref:FHA domain-containing protein n=1 Tax=Oscillatoria sp. CS-180 TaxID=3021720 RepID=UPI00232D436E|nr:FHA domain-containing protein [Oscillatoria sp. CS-180]MDB9525348.1 FHA domain-containing protein [Oscillatoria sp. CS-180]
MIVCPNCNHQNPDGAVQCEACYTPLPALTNCPNCGASVQSDASFCGQCGFDLRSANLPSSIPSSSEEHSTSPIAEKEVEIPDLIPPDPLIASEEITGTVRPAIASPPQMSPETSPVASIPAPIETNQNAPSLEADGATQLQINKAQLFHTQTNTEIEIPAQLHILHIGKPNDRIPPTIDVSGFPNSEIVSRVHADIRIEGDIYYIEDVGSSNGTYINNMPLPPGNRHRLRAGDRIALGKGDKVTFIFQSG